MKKVEHIIVSDTEPDTSQVGDDENDNKCGVLSKAAVAKQPPHQVNRNSFVRQNNTQNGLNAPFSNLNLHQSTQPTSSAMQETFWTMCPTCNIRYHYYSNYVNRALHCKKCSKPFIAYDLGSQDASHRPKQSQSGGQDLPLKSNINRPFEQKELSNQGTSKMTASSAAFPPTQIGSPQRPEMCRGKTAPVFVDIRTKQKDEKHEKLMGGMREGAAMPNLDCKSRKRSRKQMVELGERDDTSISVKKEDVEIENGNNPSAGQGTGVDGYGDRQQHVSYNKGVSGDKNDLASPLKKAWAHQSAGDSKPWRKKAVGGDDQKHAGVTRSCSNSVERFNQNGVGLCEGDVQNNNSKVGTVNEQASRPPSVGEKKVELIIDSDSEPDTILDNNLPVFYSPYPEFSDFDNHKAENFLAVDQILAVYDMLDGMPRFYAHIRKVFSPEFKMKLRWLVPHPEDQMESAWVRADLPVGCGKFRCGGLGYTSDLLTFSHQVQCEKGERGSYIIYLRKGETWALFKDWDIHWSSSQKNHREYKYEVVEILSDYVKNVGVKVGYLDKVTGFVSLFQQTRLTVVGSFFIKPKELYKFSHQIPLSG